MSKNTENINPKVSATSNGRAMILSKCAISGSRKSRFIKNQEAKGLLSNLGIKTPLSKVPILNYIFFKCNSIDCVSKMNKIANKFLLAGDKFMPEMHLEQLGCFIVLVNHLLKTKKEFRNLKKQEI